MLDLPGQPTLDKLGLIGTCSRLPLQVNAARLHAADRVRFVQGAYLFGVPTPLDIIVSNPPYVAERDAPGLAPEVGGHEPAIALFGGPDGLRDVRALLREASTLRMA